MTEDFKRRLEAYERGELSEKELEAFEKELEKLEQFQEVLASDESDEKSELDKPSPTNKQLWKDHDKQRKILRRSKWKARIQTAFYAVALLVALTIVSTILTAIYYEWGTNRGETYRDIINYSMTVTDPYGHLGGTGASIKPYFSMAVEHDLQKQIGYKRINYGKMEVNFILSLMSVPETTYYGKPTTDATAFFYPRDYDFEIESDWDRLEKLPEGTVASAYISFTELADTKTVFDYIEDKDLSLLWLAVYSGIEASEDSYDIAVFDPLGFPAHPIWHDDDFTLESREETKGFLGGGTVSESYSSPDYDVGDAHILHEQFFKTLNFLKKYERKANKLLFGQLNLSERIDYLEENGIEHYGIVVTGPTKEILSLKDESWINVMQIDEVELWDWYSFED